MTADSRQEVFPFLAEDPEYRRALYEERVIHDVIRDLEPEIRAHMFAVIREVAKEALPRKFEAVVREAVEQSTQGIDRKLNEVTYFLRRLLESSRNEVDPADWWKRGWDVDNDEDIPF